MQLCFFRDGVDPRHCQELKLFRHQVEFRSQQLFLPANVQADIVRLLDHYQGLPQKSRQNISGLMVWFKRYHQARFKGKFHFSHEHICM